MKKLIRFLVHTAALRRASLVLAGIAVSLSGCSGLPNIPLVLGTPTLPPPTDTSTPVPTETPIPTQNMFATSTSTPLTFTPTVTMIGAELFTPTGTATGTVTPLPTFGLPVGAEAAGYFTQQSVGFLSILTSSSVIYWNEGPCNPRNIMISAFVEDLVNTDRVFLFMRLREKKNTLNVTEWGSPARMIKADNGSYNYNIRTFNIRRYYYFIDAWLEYQLVAYNEDREEIGRTPIYDRNISLVRCRSVQ